MSLSSRGETASPTIRFLWPERICVNYLILEFQIIAQLSLWLPLWAVSRSLADSRHASPVICDLPSSTCSISSDSEFQRRILWSEWPPPLARMLALQGHHCRALTAPLCKRWLLKRFWSFRFQTRTEPSRLPEAILLFCTERPQTSSLWAMSRMKTEFLDRRSLWAMEQSLEPVRSPHSNVFSMQLILER